MPACLSAILASSYRRLPSIRVTVMYAWMSTFLLHSHPCVPVMDALHIGWVLFKHRQVWKILHVEDILSENLVNALSTAVTLDVARYASVSCFPISTGEPDGGCRSLRAPYHYN